MSMKAGLLDEIRQLSRVELAAVLAAASARMLEAETEPTVTTTTEPDVNISAAEAARRLGVSVSYLYKNAARLPFVARIGRRITCSTSALERYRKARIRA